MRSIDLVRNLACGGLLGIAAMLATGCSVPAGPAGAEPVAALSEALTQTPATFAATSVTVDITLPPLSSTDRADLVLGARTSLSVDDRGQTTGAIASAGALTIGNDATIADAIATGNVSLGDRTHGAAIAAGGTATLGASATASSVQQRVSLPAQSVIRDLIGVPAATKNISLARGDTAPLSPGSYGQLTVNGGATLTLGTGTYYFRTLDIEPQAILAASGPVTVYVVTTLVFRGTVNDGGDATRLKVFYAGSAAVQLGAPTRGLWVAPNASMTGIAGSYAGFLYASSLELSPGSSIAAVASPLALLAPGLVGTGNTFTATQDVPFSGTVATFADPNTSDTANRFAATIAWGDGSTSPGVVGGSASAFSVTGTHAYAMSGTFHVTVSIADSSTGLVSSAASTAHVGSELAASGVSIGATQGVAFTGVVARLTDVDASAGSSTFAATIAWGDGATSVGTVAGGAGSFTVTGTHIYAQPGTFVVTVSIVDAADGAAAGASTAATVIAQLEAVGMTFTASLGVATAPVVAILTDLNTNDPLSSFAATIQWGDGSSDSSPSPNVFIVAGSAAGTFEVGGNHTYASAGTFAVTVSIVDANDGATTVATTLATVTSQLSATGIPFNASQGVPVGPVVALVTDPNTSDSASSFVATVVWGDGSSDISPSPNVFVVAGGAPGTFEVGGLHTYASAGTFTVAVTVVDSSNGAVATTTTTATVSSSLALTSAPFAASPGTAFGGLVATVTDANTNATTSDIVASIAWGDGSNDAAGSANVFVVGGNGPGTFEVGGLHTYAAAGAVVVTVTVSDTSSGAVASVSFTVDVM